jgi:hypothetical protein
MPEEGSQETSKNPTESKNGLIGVICSENLDKAVCFEGSHYHITMKKEDLKNTRIIYIDTNCLVTLIPNCFNGNGEFEFNINEIKKYRVR